ncbi:MAG TPA: DUF3788 family protein [Candidatus Eisenbacteria bacterium]|nr:DUF3788 family protein [Candidatus Eisenbacteria bacterium]
MTTVAGTKKQSITPGQNAFAGQKKSPTGKALASVLDQTLPLWNQLIADLKTERNIDTAEWHTGSVKLGWSMRLQLNQRNIVYLGPRQGWFVAAFVLGDKAVAAARNSALPAEVIKNINNSKRYAEGTAVRIDMKNPQDLQTVKILAKIKIEN